MANICGIENELGSVCENEIKPLDNFCSGCGAKVTGRAQVVTKEASNASVNSSITEQQKTYTADVDHSVQRKHEEQQHTCNALPSTSVAPADELHSWVLPELQHTGDVSQILITTGENIAMASMLSGSPLNSDFKPTDEHTLDTQTVTDDMNNKPFMNANETCIEGSASVLVRDNTSDSSDLEKALAVESCQQPSQQFSEENQSLLVTSNEISEQANNSWGIQRCALVLNAIGEATLTDPDLFTTGDAVDQSATVLSMQTNNDSADTDNVPTFLDDSTVTDHNKRENSDKFARELAEVSDTHQMVNVNGNKQQQRNDSPSNRLPDAEGSAEQQGQQSSRRDMIATSECQLTQPISCQTFDEKGDHADSIRMGLASDVCEDFLAMKKQSSWESQSLPIESKLKIASDVMPCADIEGAAAVKVLEEQKHRNIPMAEASGQSTKAVAKKKGGMKRFKSIGSKITSAFASAVGKKQRSTQVRKQGRKSKKKYDQMLQNVSIVTRKPEEQEENVEDYENEDEQVESDANYKQNTISNGKTGACIHEPKPKKDTLYDARQARRMEASDSRADEPSGADDEGGKKCIPSASMYSVNIEPNVEKITASRKDFSNITIISQLTTSGTRVEPSDPNVVSVCFHVVLSPHFEYTSGSDDFYISVYEDHTGWNFRWKMEFEKSTEMGLCIMKWLVDIPRCWTSNLKYKYALLAQKKGSNTSVMELIGTDETAYRQLNVPVSHRSSVVWHQYDGVSKPKWSVLKTCSTAVRSAVGSFIDNRDLAMSEYDAHSIEAALSALPVVVQEINHDSSANQVEPIEQIMHEIDCVERCIKNSFMSATSGNPMGAQFSNEILMRFIVKNVDAMRDAFDAVSNHKTLCYLRFAQSVLFVMLLQKYDLYSRANLDVNVVGVLCNALRIQSDYETKTSSNYVRLVQTHFPSYKIYAPLCLLNFCLHVSKKEHAETLWLYVVPLLHFLHDKSKPFTMIVTSVDSSEKCDEWWGLFDPLQNAKENTKVLTKSK